MGRRDGAREKRAGGGGGRGGREAGAVCCIFVSFAGQVIRFTRDGLRAADHVHTLIANTLIAGIGGLAYRGVGSACFFFVRRTIFFVSLFGVRAVFWWRFCFCYSGRHSAAAAAPLRFKRPSPPTLLTPQPTLAPSLGLSLSLLSPSLSFYLSLFLSLFAPPPPAPLVFLRGWGFPGS